MKNKDLKRYVSIEQYDGTIKVLTEEDNFADAINDGDTACWVWQFADSAKQAKEQHFEKMEAFELDGTKETY